MSIGLERGSGVTFELGSLDRARHEAQPRLGGVTSGFSVVESPSRAANVEAKDQSR